MRSRPLGATGLEVTELGLGTWGLAGDGYGPVAPDEQDRVIERALALGIRLFDTADSYGQGAMETRLGRLLAPREDVVIVTKLGTERRGNPPRKRFDPEYLDRALAESRARLERSRLDLVLLHHPSLAAIERGEATTWAAAQVARGTARAWGVSAGTVDVARAALTRGAQVISLAYNAFHPSDLGEVREAIAQRRAGVLAHSVLAYGLLAGLWTADHQFPPTDHRSERWTPEALRQRVRQLDALRPTVSGQVTSLRSAALRFVLASPVISAALLGPRSVVQLDQLVREAGKGPDYLTPAQLSGLVGRLRAVGVPA